MQIVIKNMFRFIIKILEGLFKKMEKISLKGVENNFLEMPDGVKLVGSVKIEFLPFFNGSGGFGNRVLIEDGVVLKKLNISIRGVDNVVKIKKNTVFNGVIGVIGSRRQVSIGENCTVNGVLINARERDIYIGDDCLFSSEIKIRSSDAHKIFDATSNNQINLPYKDVIIGNHVWIGQGVFVGKNSTIPDNCVVGANSIITKNFNEAGCVIVGNNKIVRKNIYWEK